MADEPVQESIRDERRAARLEQARGPVKPERVRVLPRDEGLRKLLKHPASGGFRQEGSVEWPLDQFTKRRLRDGDVTIEPQAEPQAAPEQQQAAPKEAKATRNQPPTPSTS